LLREQANNLINQRFSFNEIVFNRGLLNR